MYLRCPFLPLHLHLHLVHVGVYWMTLGILYLHILKDICQILCSSMVGNILRGAVDGIPVYLGSIQRGNRRRHPNSWVDLRAGHGRGYGPVTVSMVKRISRVPEWIPDTS
ncbi:hypothetical protein OSB04_006845 [Centaurea solstitialis]|uniref:Uncharacterized protein n=1 Tax=Centaurea solstitialis TaxID=347529 RepID=A0AA38TVF5_9ASTR|nr:hypothetical protein OSB04_006845 [Centaurea solstitialis]